MSEVEFKQGDQVIVDNYLEQGDQFKLIASNVCLVLVVGKYDLIVKPANKPKIIPKRNVTLNISIILISCFLY